MKFDWLSIHKIDGSMSNRFGVTEKKQLHKSDLENKGQGHWKFDRGDWWGRSLSNGHLSNGLTRIWPVTHRISLVISEVMTCERKR